MIFELRILHSFNFAILIPLNRKTPSSGEHHSACSVPLMYDIVAVKIIGASDRRITPWKNGQGWTAEVAISPEGASLDEFDWRISIAGTDHGGPFSSFPGIDRTLLILKGATLLTIGDRQPVVLDPNSAPIRFPGRRADYRNTDRRPDHGFQCDDPAWPFYAQSHSFHLKGCRDEGTLGWDRRDDAARWRRPDFPSTANQRC